MYIVIDPCEKNVDRCVLAPDGHEGLARWESMQPTFSIMWNSRADAELAVKKCPFGDRLIIWKVEDIKLRSATVEERAHEMFYLAK
jgi:hypothetical protein